MVATRVKGTHSRFEVDLNRPRERAVYLKPEDAWGLEVWREALPQKLVTDSLARFDRFYQEVEALLQEKVSQYGRFVVLDIHSYNHRRGGPTAPFDDPTENPQVNIGTGSVDRDMWGSVIERIMYDLSRFDFPGGKLDVRENVKFQGGHFPRWINHTFAGRGCAIAIEFKKFFMDEWSGAPEHPQINAIRQALQSTIPGIEEFLDG